jgi:hypothetical protein
MSLLPGSSATASNCAKSSRRSAPREAACRTKALYAQATPERQRIAAHCPSEKSGIASVFRSGRHAARNTIVPNYMDGQRCYTEDIRAAPVWR